MTPQRHLRLITLLFLVLVALLPAYAQEAPLSGFDDCVSKALREWEVPGLAIAIVKTDSDCAGQRLPGEKARRVLDI